MISHVTLGCTSLSTRMKYFQPSKAFVKKQLSCSINNLHTDNGGEYVNMAFEIFYREHHTLHQHSVPYTPKKNGVVKRRSQTLKKKDNCMIQSKSLAPSFLAKEIICANYIQNIMPHKEFQHMI